MPAVSALRRAACSFVAVAALAVAREARADAEESRFDVLARPGLVSAGSHEPVNVEFHDIGCTRAYGVGPLAEIGADMRLSPRWLAIGVLAGWRNVSCSDDGRSQSRTAFWAGPYTRATSRVGPFDLFGSLGVAYANDSTTYSASFSAQGDHPATIMHHGLALEASIGAPVRVGDAFSIGPFLALTPVVPLGSSFSQDEAPGLSVATSAKAYVSAAIGVEADVRL